MKRSQLIRHLLDHRCSLLREGSRHSIWLNAASGKMTAVPRHHETKDMMARKICKDLDIDLP